MSQTALGIRTARTALRRRRFRTLCGAIRLALAFAAVSSIGYAISRYVMTSPRFQVRNIRVEGANVLREERIMEAAGITSADNVLLSDTEAIRERVAALPYVKRAEVQRVYPDTVVIRIEERVAAAILLVNNRAYEVDAEGVVLRAVNPVSAPAMPLITNVPNLPVLEPGTQIIEPAFYNALEVWRAFCSVPLSQELTLSELSAEAANTIRMICDEIPYEIRWGRTDFYLQAQRLEALWRQRGGVLPCAAYLDLRFDNDVVCG